jgi:AraC-like DNA-binding protein
MLLEPTALASTFRYLAETLQQDHGLDPGPLFRRAGIPLESLRESGARVSQPGTRRLWDLCIEATGDPAIGLKVGRRIRPEGLHALGYAWMSSRCLADALARVARYVAILVHLPLDARVETTQAGVALTVTFPDPAHQPHPAGVEATLAGLVELARRAAGKPVLPRAVAFSHPCRGRAGDYAAAFGAPVEFGAPANVLVLDRAAAERPLPTDNPDVAAAVDLVAKRYVAGLETQPVAARVRALLQELLPTGEAGQDLVAARLNRSPSTLRRQLQAEGLSYRTVLDETRRELAEAYGRDERFSRAEVAYLLGFSDQSNLARAVRRWKQRPRTARPAGQSQ